MRFKLRKIHFFEAISLIVATVALYITFNSAQITTDTKISAQDVKLPADNFLSLKISQIEGINDKNTDTLYLAPNIDCRVYIRSGDFGIADNDCTNGEAFLLLPMGTYSVWVRAYKPYSNLGLVSCSVDKSNGQLYCSTFNDFQTTTEKTDISDRLLYIYIGGSEKPEKVNLFDGRLNGFYWFGSDIKEADLRLYKTEFEN